MFLNIVLLIVGFILLVKGADFFVDGSSKIADRFGIPQLIIGLTIVAMGTSAPEAAISIGAAVQGSTGIAIGNIIGSNILNVLLILGITSIIAVLPVAKSSIRFEFPFLIFVSALLVVFGVVFKEINLISGITFWGLFIVFLLKLILDAKKQINIKKEQDNSLSEEALKNVPKQSMLLLIAITVIGLAMIVFGSDITVESAKKIAQELGVTERIIGLTVIAFGTSLPELVTSVIAAIKGKSDIAVGNIVGSNIFNILFVLGTTAFIKPINYESKFIIDGIVAIAAAVFLYLCVFKDRKIGKAGGIAMLIGYAAYSVYLFNM